MFYTPNNPAFTKIQLFFTALSSFDLIEIIALDECWLVLMEITRFYALFSCLKKENEHCFYQLSSFLFSQRHSTAVNNQIIST